MIAACKETHVALVSKNHAFVAGVWETMLAPIAWWHGDFDFGFSCSGAAAIYSKGEGYAKAIDAEECEAIDSEWEAIDYEWPAAEEGIDFDSATADIKE